MAEEKGGRETRERKEGGREGGGRRERREKGGGRREERGGRVRREGDERSGDNKFNII